MEDDIPLSIVGFFDSPSAALTMNSSVGFQSSSSTSRSMFARDNVWSRVPSARRNSTTGGWVGVSAVQTKYFIEGEMPSRRPGLSVTRV